MIIQKEHKPWHVLGMLVKFNYYPILGVHLGFEFTDGVVEGNPISYLLIDLFIVRLQFAWYPE